MQDHLGLEWSYKKDDVKANAGIDVNEVNSATLIPPDLKILLRLQDLIKRGNLNAVAKEAETLRQNPQFVLFAQTLTRFAKDFEVKQLEILSKNLFS
ncbi:MAG: hypothetical protein KME43_09145 [Myxacorys chilensis ATA2-1-KO14]|nr:hypothetical protein [Myxacorys chilensis ATA2-1-KO14]